MSGVEQALSQSSFHQRTHSFFIYYYFFKKGSMEVTKEWLETIFKRESYENSITAVLDVDSAPAVGKGENYLSDMVRLKFDVILGSGRKVRKSVLIKGMPTTEARKQMINQMGVYMREIMVYRDIFPAMEQVMSEVDGSEPLWGKCLDYRPYDRLILEDLSVYGFKMANKLKGLDLDHCKIVINNLAKFHAVSVVLKERGLIPMDVFTKSIFEIPAFDVSVFHERMLERLIAYFNENFTDDWKPLLEKLRQKLSGKVSEGFKMTFTRDEGKFAVLNHGDCWLNNMLFKYDDMEKPIAHKFVDFQVCLYQSPALDLQYFLNTSPSLIVRENNLDDLILQYYNSLVKFMKKYGCTTSPPSYDEILDEYKRFASYGLTVAVLVAPFTMIDKPEKMPDLEEMHKDFEKQMSDEKPPEEPFSTFFFESKTFQDNLKVVLKNAERKQFI